MIDEFSKVIFSYNDVMEQGIDVFYTNMKMFLQDENSNKSASKSEELSDLANETRKLDERAVSKEQKRKYLEIRQNPLFKKIMGENAQEQLPQLKKVFS